MGINNGLERESKYFLASLSYLTLGIIGIFIIVSEMDRDEFLRFHAKQSIGFWLISVPIWIIFSFLFKYLYSISSFYLLNKLFFYLWKIFYIFGVFFIIIFAIYLSFIASQGNKREVKFICNILKRFGVKL